MFKPLTILTTVWFLGLAFVVGCGRGEWKPSGDGSTIVNTRTGEIRDTATGMSREELVSNSLHQKNQQVGLENQQLRAEVQKLTAENKSLKEELSTRTVQPRTEEESADAQKSKYDSDVTDARKAKNAGTLKTLRALVEDADTDITSYDDGVFGWNHWVTPIRLGKPITEQHRDDFMKWLNNKRVRDKERLTTIEQLAKYKKLSLEEYCKRTSTTLPPSHDTSPWKDLRDELTKIEYVGENKGTVSWYDFETN